jgi:hypothetical protein
MLLVSYLMPNRFKSFWIDMLALGPVVSGGGGGEGADAAAPRAGGASGSWASSPTVASRSRGS